ncbi:hypothetical protein FE784_36545 [Paenibacillus hemerocallicola]|uniref:Uncharacterized protein n=1 Tax=Paenibacillus hemerocallicola TaxID=1172614 RepID=A0A5C4SZG8_9BACL|nr:hypothetical protein [Paenibacillus hemerocallicola]TNJ60042.1 hypothetical protein FE784_36545 [Paenibacillus hemerocallicola]
MKKMNIAVWGPLLLLPGLFLTVAATGESGLAGAVLAFTSTLVVSASLLLNLYGVNRSRNNHRVMMFFIGFFFVIINMFLYMYSLIVGIAKVSFFSNGWAQLLFILALIIPVIVAFIFAMKAGLPSTKDKRRR